MLDKIDTFKREGLHAHLKSLLRGFEAAMIVEVLADVLSVEAKGALARGHYETALEFDRIAVDLWAQPERFENEDSGQEEPSYYAEEYLSARDRLLRDSKP
jgi:hypothetical protein